MQMYDDEHIERLLNCTTQVVELTLRGLALLACREKLILCFKKKLSISQNVIYRNLTSIFLNKEEMGSNQL